MNEEALLALADRMLDLMDRRTTDLAPSVMFEPTDAYSSQDYLEREKLRIFGHGPLFWA
jgi:hypothetical protein